MIPLIRAEVIQVHSWLTAAEFLEIAAVAETTPGPIAVNIATFVGYRMGGLAGAALCTLGVVLPAFLLMMTLGLILRSVGHRRISKQLISLRPVIIAMIFAAGLWLSQQAIVSYVDAVIYGLVLVALFRGRIPFPLILAASAVTGILIYA